MILEPNLIQLRGFHNTEENGEIVGFQLNVRLTYYRGIFLSQLRPHKVVVDGEVFPREDIIWHVNGRDFSYEQMKTESSVHWGPEHLATLKIRKPGGLSQGYHEVTTGYKVSSSYLPPNLQTGIDNEDPEPIFQILGFGQQHETRKLLIV